MFRKSTQETLIKAVPYVLGGTSLTSASAVTITPRGLVAEVTALTCGLVITANAAISLTIAGGTAGEVYDLSYTLSTDDGQDIADMQQVEVTTINAASVEGYSTVADFLDYAGADRIADLVADDYGRLDYGRIQSELQVASARVDNFLQKRYAVPLNVPAPIEVVDAVHAIALFGLHRWDVPENVKDRKAAALGFLSGIQKGLQELDVDAVPQSNGGPVISSPDRIFSAKTMEGF